MKRLGEFTSLTSGTITGQVTDQGLKHLAGLSTLTRLELVQT